MPASSRRKTLPSFFFNGASPPEIYTLSLHDALPICRHRVSRDRLAGGLDRLFDAFDARLEVRRPDRKSTRLNSSHMSISYAVFCLKKKNKERDDEPRPHTVKLHKVVDYSDCAVHERI